MEDEKVTGLVVLKTTVTLVKMHIYVRSLQFNILVSPSISLVVFLLTVVIITLACLPLQIPACIAFWI